MKTLAGASIRAELELKNFGRGYLLNTFASKDGVQVLPLRQNRIHRWIWYVSQQLLVPTGILLDTTTLRYTNLPTGFVCGDPQYASDPTRGRGLIDFVPNKKASPNPMLILALQILNSKETP